VQSLHKIGTLSRVRRKSKHVIPVQVFRGPQKLIFDHKESEVFNTVYAVLEVLVESQADGVCVHVSSDSQVVLGCEHGGIVVLVAIGALEVVGLGVFAGGAVVADHS